MEGFQFMKSQMFKIISIISIIAFVSFFAYLVLGTVPPEYPNEQDIKHGWTDWSLETETAVYGKTIWSDFADNVNNSIKVYHCTYYGGVFHSFDDMTWETEPEAFSSSSLNYYDLESKWNGSVSVFKFRFEDDVYKVTFSIPKTENGLDKYSSLLEAWENEELHQIVEKR